jgi:hypothetical protein
MEWGAKATELMWELKGLFDPGFVLNPGVILNRCGAGAGAGPGGAPCCARAPHAWGCACVRAPAG